MSKFYIYLKSPLNRWKMIKNIIKKPIKHWHLGRPLFFCPGLWLTIASFDIIYKMKYDDPCFEFPPFFHIIFFNRWGLTLRYDCPSKSLTDDWYLDDIYWQIIIRMTDLGESLANAAKAESGWIKQNDECISQILTAKDIIKEVIKN